jgi:dipeptidyl aminopeptidase/acylaminoacyl peptidase
MSAGYTSTARWFRVVTTAIAVAASIAMRGSGEASDSLTVHDYFRNRILTDALVSPTGKFLGLFGQHWTGEPLYSSSTGNEYQRNSTISVRHNETKTTEVVFDFSGPIRYFAWIDDDTLFISYEDTFGTYNRFVDVSFSDGELVFVRRYARTPGALVDGIPDRKDEVLWSFYTETKSIIYRTPISNLVGYQPETRDEVWQGLSNKYVVARLKGFIPWWITDRDGVVRAAVGFDNPDELELTLWYRESRKSPWRELYRTSDLDEAIVPIGIAPDNRNLLVLSDKDRDTKALVEFQVDRAELGRTLFEHPRADVLDILYDFNGMEVLTAVYEEGGIRRYQHLDSFNDRFQRSLEHAFSGQSVAITSMSRDSRYLSVLVSSSTNPGVFYLVDTETRTASVVGQTMPWLHPDAMSGARLLEVTSFDGTKIEAFLTMPPQASREPPPLLVLPHGGPLGVRDNRDFDPLVQYIAARDIAVLQVNFRGSGGYGKKFLEAGFRQFAKGIEDDIDAAVDLVVDQGFVDDSRICIAGMSYGGYSAVMSVIRDPKRYLCAVTVAGLSDLPLFLHSRGIANDPEARKKLAEMIGDPDAEYEELIEISPAFRADAIQTPILIVHGTEDRRVDIEHAYRLKAMLDAHGKTYNWRTLEGAGHSLNSKQWIEVAEALFTFVDGFLHPMTVEFHPRREN